MRGIVKVRCDFCHSKMAVWEYIPRGYEYYCDECVPRGCSCNLIGDVDDENAEEATDEQGRLLPCCEFGYSSNGWTANHLLDKRSPLEHNFKYPKWINVCDSKFIIGFMRRINAKRNKRGSV